MATKPHGGKRKGAGRRPVEGEEPQAKISITLTAAQKAWLKAQPGGASAMVRNLIQMAQVIDGMDPSKFESLKAAVEKGK